MVGLLRPGVVWFGETLPEDTIEEVDSWIDQGKIDLMLVIGTTATVYPAAGMHFLESLLKHRLLNKQLMVERLYQTSTRLWG